MKNAKKKGKNYHHGDLKEYLLKSALKVIRLKGIEQLSLRELAREVGVSEAAPYRHFKNKEALIAALNQQGFELKFQMMKAAVESAQGNPLEMFYQCGLGYFRMGELYPQHFKLMLSSAKSFSKSDYPEILKATDKSFALMRDVIIYCQKNKIIGDGDPYALAVSGWCSIHGFTSLYIEGRLGWTGINESNSEQVVRSLLHQILVGFSNGVPDNSFHFFGVGESIEYEKGLEKITVLD